MFRNIIRAFLSIIVLIGVVTISTPSQARYEEWSASPTDSSANVYVVGDSLTYWAAPFLHEARPNWHIEAVPGRQVQTLETQISEILAVDPNPRTIVVALGTNTRVGSVDSATGQLYPADHYTIYRDSLAQVPAATKLVLVTPYRDPKKYSRTSNYPENHKAYHQYHYAKAMLNLANVRPMTCIVPWRYTVKLNPDLLWDGIHATIEGRKVWVRKVTETVRFC